MSHANSISYLAKINIFFTLVRFSILRTNQTNENSRAKLFNSSHRALLDFVVVTAHSAGYRQLLGHVAIWGLRITVSTSKSKNASRRSLINFILILTLISQHAPKADGIRHYGLWRPRNPVTLNGSCLIYWLNYLRLPVWFSKYKIVSVKNIIIFTK